MDEGNASVRSRSGACGWLWLLAAASGCGLDFDVGSRGFLCPPEVAETCQVCNADGSCREERETPALTDPGSSPEPIVRPDPSPTPDASLPAEQQPTLPLEPPDVVVASDAGAQPPPDAGEPPPPLDDICVEYASRSSGTLCLAGDQLCFDLGSVLSPALVAWLDPTTLPREGSRHWCDRSGQRHHALLQPELSGVVIEPDGRAVGEALARSLLLDGASLTLSEGTQPVLVAGNFAVVLAVAGLPGGQPFELFESGARSRINLTLVPGTGRAEGRITSLDTALASTPVVTQSSVYDGAFHLYSLYRRSEVQVLDDVLQLRLNGVLEFRGSSIAIPRALDLSSLQPPRLGSRSTAAGVTTTGRGRVAAAIVFRGAVPEDELARLENFLCTALAVCGAPAAPPALPVPVLPAPGVAAGLPAR